MPRVNGRRSDRHGFTLLEVLIALVITLLALNVLYGAIAHAVQAAARTAAAEEAVSRAQSRLAAIGNPAVLTGERSGDDGGGFRWTTRVRLAGVAPAPQPVRAGPWADGTGLFDVAVIIAWHEGRTDRRFVLTGAVLGPVRGAAP